MLFAKAFAEAAEAAETLPASSGSFSVVKLVLILFGLYEIVIGAMSVLTKKLYGSQAKEYAKYTDESVIANAPAIGVSYILLGLLLIAVELGLMKTLPLIPSVVICAVIITAFIWIYARTNKRLVKKEDAGK